MKWILVVGAASMVSFSVGLWTGLTLGIDVQEGPSAKSPTSPPPSPITDTMEKESDPQAPQRSSIEDEQASREPETTEDPSLTPEPTGVSTDEESLPDWRSDLMNLSGGERDRAVHGLLVYLESVDLETRATKLIEVFQNEGWLAERHASMIGPRIATVMMTTLDDLDRGELHSELLGVIGARYAQDCEVNVLGELTSLCDRSIGDEYQRLEAPEQESSFAESTARLIEHLKKSEEFEDEEGQAEMGEAQLMFALARSISDEHSLRFVEDVATTHPSRHRRLVAIVALGTTDRESSSVDDFLLRTSLDPRRSVSERYFSWRALSRRGREEMIPIAERYEILRLWKESGIESSSELFEN